MSQIYLAGPISGHTYDEAVSWRERFINLMPYHVQCFSPLRSKEDLRSEGVLKQTYDNSPLETEDGLTTRDHNDCVNADVVVANLRGARKVSIGTVMEIAWAYDNKIPVVLIMERYDNNPHDHPMIRHAVKYGYWVETLEEAARIAETLLVGQAGRRIDYTSTQPQLASMGSFEVTYRCSNCPYLSGCKGNCLYPGNLYPQTISVGTAGQG